MTQKHDELTDEVRGDCFARLQKFDLILVVILYLCRARNGSLRGRQSHETTDLSGLLAKPLLILLPLTGEHGRGIEGVNRRARGIYEGDQTMRSNEDAVGMDSRVFLPQIPSIVAPQDGDTVHPVHDP